MIQERACGEQRPARHCEFSTIAGSSLFGLRNRGKKEATNPTYGQQRRFIHHGLVDAEENHAQVGQDYTTGDDVVDLGTGHLNLSVEWRRKIMVIVKISKGIDSKVDT